MTAMGPFTTPLVSRTKKSIIDGPYTIKKTKPSMLQLNFVHVVDDAHHSNGNNGYVDSLVVTGDGSETSAGGDRLRSGARVQVLCDLLCSVLGSYRENSVRNITIPDLNRKKLLRSCTTKS